jgi:hypothetical protein
MRRSSVFAAEEVAATVTSPCRRSKSIGPNQRNEKSREWRFGLFEPLNTVNGQYQCLSGALSSSI